MPADPNATLTAYFEGLNANRYADVAALFSEDAELWGAGTGWRHGRGQIEDFFRGALSSFPIHRDRPIRILLSGASATVELRFEHEHESGVELEGDGVDIFDFDDAGQVRRLRMWFDSLAVQSVLDAGPANASQGSGG
jgi:hypothetical protein